MYCFKVFSEIYLKILKLNFFFSFKVRKTNEIFSISIFQIKKFFFYNFPWFFLISLYFCSLSALAVLWALRWACWTVATLRLSHAALPHPPLDSCNDSNRKDTCAETMSTFPRMFVESPRRICREVRRWHRSVAPSRTCPFVEAIWISLQTRKDHRPIWASLPVL